MLHGSRLPELQRRIARCELCASWFHLVMARTILCLAGEIRHAIVVRITADLQLGKVLLMAAADRVLRQDDAHLFGK